MTFIQQIATIFSQRKKFVTNEKTVLSQEIREITMTKQTVREKPREVAIFYSGHAVVWFLLLSTPG